eukprot:260046-Amphidinium_carterae.1
MLELRDAPPNETKDAIRDALGLVETNFKPIKPTGATAQSSQVIGRRTSEDPLPHHQHHHHHHHHHVHTMEKLLSALMVMYPAYRESGPHAADEPPTEDPPFKIILAYCSVCEGTKGLTQCMQPRKGWLEHKELYLSLR